MANQFYTDCLSAIRKNGVLYGKTLIAVFDNDEAKLPPYVKDKKEALDIIQLAIEEVAHAQTEKNTKIWRAINQTYVE